MKKIMPVLVAVAMLAAAAMAPSGAAHARPWGYHGSWGHRWGWGHHWGWGPGPFFGGFIAGAIIGNALAAPYYYDYYGPYGYSYGPYPYWRGCYWRTMWNGYRWVRVCY